MKFEESQARIKELSQQMELEKLEMIQVRNKAENDEKSL